MRIVTFWQPMRRKLPLLITALLLAALAAFSWLAYRHLANALVAAARERVTNVSTQLATAFAASDDRLKGDKRRLHADSAFVQFLTRGDARSERLARAALEESRRASESIVADELWDRRGRLVLASTRPDYRPGQLDAAPVTGPFPSRSLVGPLIARGDTVFSEVRLPVVAASGDTLGIVRQFQRVADGQSGALVRTLIGPDAVLLIGNASGDLWTDMARRVDAPPGPHTIGATGDAAAQDGTQWVAAMAAVPRLPWLVWVALPRRTVLAPARALLGEIAIVALGIMGIGGVAAWLLGRHLTRPLVDVIAAAESIAAGDYSRRVALRRDDEMGRLAATFNTMAGHVETATHDLEVQQLELELSNQELADAIDRAAQTTEQLRAVVERAPLGIAVLDLNGTVLSWNPAAERIFGWTAAEVVGRFQPAIAPGQIGEFDEHRRLVLDGEQLNNRLVPRQRKDGTTIQVSISGAALYDPAGAPVGLLGIFDDVTDEIRTQAQLASERKFLRQIIDINPNFLFAKDRDGRFTLVNQAVADAYGTSTEGMIGKSDADFNSNAAEVEAFRLADLNVLDSGATLKIPEERITTASGQLRWLHTVKRPIIGEDGRADQLLGVSTDITERKQLEAQLLQSQKMEAVGQLAGGVAHDFNNVLAAIRGFGELVDAQLDERSPARDDVAEIIAAADRAAALTQQLLAFSRRQLLQPVIFSPNSVVEGVSKLLLRLIGAEVRCETRLAADLGKVLADPGQLEQVLVNLAVNARDAMPNGGTLTIETGNVALDGDHAARLGGAEVVQAGEYVMLAVSDTGVGMSQATQARVFEPFFTTKDPGKGTGLGLSTVYGIVRQSGGYVSLYSELGHGTTFRVYLPRAEGEVLTPSPRPREAARPHATETILVVDDDTSVRAVAARILARAGYNVLTASSAREAEAVWTQHGGPIHLLMTDVMMPDMDGGGLARQLLRTRPEARVLYTSGYTNESVIGRGMITSDTIFLGKPFAIDAVLRKVREALSSSGAAPPRVAPFR